MREEVKIKILQNMLEEVTKRYDYFLEKQEQVLKKTFEKAVKDPLTKFYNREYLFDYAKKLFDKAKRENIKFLGIFLDLDNFKSVNDIYGHEKGDEILKQISSVIKKSFREYDTFVRYGGDEFLILIELKSDYTKEKIEKILKKLQERIENKFKQFHISISFGMATNLEAKDIKKLIEIADMRMYEMKKRKKIKAK